MLSELEFPTIGLVVGQSWPEPPVLGLPVWSWDGVKWIGKPLASEFITVAPHPPPNPIANQLWWDNSEDGGDLFIYFDMQWVRIGGASIDDGVY